MSVQISISRRPIHSGRTLCDFTINVNGQEATLVTIAHYDQRTKTTTLEVSEALFQGVLVHIGFIEPH